VNIMIVAGAALAVMLSAEMAMAQAERCGLVFVDEAHMNLRVAEMDADSDGAVSLAEHEAFIATLVVDDSTRAGFIADFYVMDADSDGVLSLTELRTGIETPTAN